MFRLRADVFFYICFSLIHPDVFADTRLTMLLY